MRDMLREQIAKVRPTVEELKLVVVTSGEAAGRQAAERRRP